MMAEAVDMLKLRSFLTCSICLDNFDNPKRLKCSHLFCKCCLEDLVEFSPDGTALIQCPMRCKVQTFLNDNETLDDLPPSYEIKGILEALELGKKSPTSQSVLCNYHHECGLEVTVYCCGNLLCNSCAGEHEKCWKDHDDRKRLIFDKREGKLSVFCEEHASKCTHICEDNTFLCMYCITRFHKDHEMDPVDSATTLVRGTLLKDSRNIQTLRMLVNKTEDHIRDAKMKLDDLLSERKLEKLLSYIDLLNKEEEIIKKTFQSIADDHIKQYPDFMQGEYYEQKLLKEDIALAIEKESIMDIVAECKLDSFHVSPLTISLPDSYDPRSQHMLGELNVDVGRKIPMENLSPISSTFRDAIRPLSRQDALSKQVIDEVKKMLSSESLMVMNYEENEARKRSSSSSEERNYEKILKNMLSLLKQNKNEDKNPNQDGIRDPTPAEALTSSADAGCSNSKNGNTHEICIALSINHTKNECLPTPSTSQRRDNIQLDRSSYKATINNEQQSNQPLHSSKRRRSPPHNFILPSRFDTSKYITSSIETYRNETGVPVTDEGYSPCSQYNANLSTPSTYQNQLSWKQRYTPDSNIDVSADSPSQRFNLSSRPRSSHASLTSINAASEHLNSSEADEEVIHIKSSPSTRVIKTIPFCPTAIEDLRVGMKVSVNISRPMLSRGTVKWTGTLPGHTGDYAGIELDAENGKHNGLFNGVQYFRCKAERGIFVKLSRVIMAWK